jgi:hypothetical protein
MHNHWLGHLRVLVGTMDPMAMDSWISLHCFVMPTFTASARTEAPVDREERRQAKIDRQKVEAEEREERRRAENEQRQAKAEDREERQQDRQMNMMLMMGMIGSMNPRAAAAMQPLQNAMMQQHCGNVGN